jgi:hypothetical protein
MMIYYLDTCFGLRSSLQYIDCARCIMDQALRFGRLYGSFLISKLPFIIPLGVEPLEFDISGRLKANRST